MRTAARDASTRAAAALRSGLRSTASVTKAVSSRSWNVRIQSGTTAPLRCEPAHAPGIFVRADSGMMFAPKGGILSAQLASIRHTAMPRRFRIFTRVWLVELRNEPVQLRRNAHEDLADDVQKFYVLGVDRAMAACA